MEPPFLHFFTITSADDNHDKDGPLLKFLTQLWLTDITVT